MNKRLKHALQVGFEPPRTKKQKEFLSGLNAPQLTYRDFFFSQIAYIRKRVWCFSAVAVIVMVSLVLWNEQVSFWKDGYPLVWIASAFIPFLALLTVAELSRSASFGMAELELSCRYSLEHIVMARVAILGISNFALLLILALVVGTWTGAPILFGGLYIFVPYLLTCAASIFALNHSGASENLYCCATIACAVSLGDSILRASKQIVFTQQYLWGWYGLCLLSLLVLVVQVRKFIGTKEKLKWNLLLTD